MIKWLSLFLLVARFALAEGMGNLGAALGGMGMGAAPFTMVSYGGSFTGQTPSLQQHRLNLSLPVYKEEKSNVSVFAGAGWLHFSEPVTLTSGVPMPANFYRLEGGGHYSRQLEDQHHFGLRLSAGSASDTPFATLKDMTFTLIGSYGFPSGEKGRWLLTLFVSNNNSFANYIPIPGFIYFHKTETFTGMFGLPFASIQWNPISLWAITLSLFGPALSAEIAYGERTGWQGALGFQWNQMTYLRHGRGTDEDRFFLDEKKAFATLRFIFAELQAGYAFGRSV